MGIGLFVMHKLLFVIKEISVVQICQWIVADVPVQSLTLVAVTASCPAEEERRSRPRPRGPPRPGSSSPWGVCCATSRGDCLNTASGWELLSTWLLSSSILLVRFILQWKRVVKYLQTATQGLTPKPRQ